MTAIETLPTSPSPFQRRVLQFRRHANIANLGGRGSGKSVSLLFDVLDHVRELGPVASVLVLRESWAGLQELSFKLFQLGRVAFGAAVSQNKGSGTLSFPNGAMVYFKNVGDADSFASAQGRTYGSASPSAMILLGELLDPTQNYIPGDVFALDMRHTCIEPGNYSQGDGSPPSVLAAMVKTMLGEWGLSPAAVPVVFDDFRGFSETVIGVLQEQGLRSASKPARKDRMGTFALIRNMLDGAVHGDSKALFFSPRVGPLIDTIQVAPRDDLRTEDLSRHWNEDHFVDALGYGLMELKATPHSSQGRVIGMW